MRGPLAVAAGVPGRSPRPLLPDRPSELVRAVARAQAHVAENGGIALSRVDEIERGHPDRGAEAVCLRVCQESGEERFLVPFRAHCRVARNRRRRVPRLRDHNLAGEAGTELAVIVRADIPGRMVVDGIGIELKVLWNNKNLFASRVSVEADIGKIRKTDFRHDPANLLACNPHPVRAMPGFAGWTPGLAWR